MHRRLLSTGSATIDSDLTRDGAWFHVFMCPLVVGNEATTAGFRFAVCPSVGNIRENVRFFLL